jgi:hypothetical protein
LGDLILGLGWKNPLELLKYFLKRGFPFVDSS